MTSDLSNYHREYSPDGSYSLFQFERSEAISVLKNSIEYSFVFFKCLFYCDMTCQDRPDKSSVSDVGSFLSEIKISYTENSQENPLLRLSIY